MDRLGGYGAALLVVLMYGAIKYDTFKDVPRYHAIRKPETCGDMDRTCVYDVTYINRHGHPNHCWNYMNGFPDPRNETYPNRTGAVGDDMMPYSTATSLLYLVAGLVVVGRESDHDPSQRDAMAIGLLLAWVASGSFELHRHPTDTSRHNDWANIAPLLAYMGLASFQVYSPTWCVIKLSITAIVMLVSNKYVYASLYTGAAVLGIGAIVQMIVRRNVVYPLIAALCALAAVASKTYSDQHDNGVAWVAGSNQFHNTAECANDMAAAKIEDLAHAQWHVWGSLAVLWYTTPLLALVPDPTPLQHIVLVTGATALIINATTNPGNLDAWMTMAFLTVLLLAVPSIVSYNIKHLYYTT